MECEWSARREAVFRVAVAAWFSADRTCTPCCGGVGALEALEAPCCLCASNRSCNKAEPHPRSVCCLLDVLYGGLLTALRLSSDFCDRRLPSPQEKPPVSTSTGPYVSTRSTSSLLLVTAYAVRWKPLHDMHCIPIDFLQSRKSHKPGGRHLGDKISCTPKSRPLKTTTTAI